MKGVSMSNFEFSGTEETNAENPLPRSGIPQWLRNKKNRWIASSALAVGLIGSSVGVAVADSGSSTPAISATSAGSHSGHALQNGFGTDHGASNARTAPATGGTTGIIGTVTTSSFTLKTPAGQSVTVDESAATTYQDGSNTSPANVVVPGNNVLVVGTVDSTTITASEISVQTNTSTAATALTVIPFDQGKPSAEKKVGTIPPDWSAGQGTLVTGTAADEGAEAALAAYPGGIVDRVVKLSDGDYNVHFIGVNWPHHVFLTSSFHVIGAE